MPDTQPDYQIRRSRADDAESILAIRKHPVVRRFQPIGHRTLRELEITLETRGSIPFTSRQPDKYQWTILHQRAIAGWVTLDVTSRLHGIGSVGYSIAPQVHGQGLAAAALLEVATIAFDPDALALERLEAVAAVDNIASRRVLETCDFELEGIARAYLIISGKRVDHARYARLLPTHEDRTHA